MKFAPLVVCIFLLIVTVASEGLMCYSCFYYKGHNLSDSSCLTNPARSTFKNCSATVIQGLHYQTEFGMDSDTDLIGKYSNNSVTLGSLVSGSRLSCVNYSGTVNNKDILIRSCALVNPTFKDNCTNAVYISLDGVEANYTKACFCSHDACNSPRTDNHAPGCPLTSYSLIAVTIVCFICKYLS